MDEGIIKVLEDNGTAPEVIAEMRGQIKPPDEDFEVWDENWPILNLFLALDGDWNIAVGMAGIMYQGIQTQAVEAAFNIFKTPHKKRIEYLAKLKAMQQAALPLLNKPKD